MSKNLMSKNLAAYERAITTDNKNNKQGRQVLNNGIKTGRTTKK